MANCLITCTCSLGFLTALITPLMAQELVDPTRPAVSLETSTGVSVATSATEFSGAQGLSLIVIQSSRRAAIIDGRVIELGGHYGKFKLIEVNEDNVVLQSAEVQRVMRLFPAVSKNLLPATRSIKASEKIKAGHVDTASAIAIKEKK